jgi:hypothetical protein
MTKQQLPFSQREGYREIPEPLRLEKLSDAFRRDVELGLVKAVELYHQEIRMASSQRKQIADWEEVMRDVWVQFLGQPLLSFQGMHHVQMVITNIIHRGEFYEVFDVIEELVDRTAKDQPQFYKEIKKIFERTRVAYRLVGSEEVDFAVVPTINEFEASTVKATFDLLSVKGSRFVPVLKHLTHAGRLLRDGKDGKSIGEASSAVEVAFRVLTDSDKEHNTVADEYFRTVNLHPIIKKMIVIPHQFASDISDGRHGTKQAGYVSDRFDAQYIFITCCATIQYLVNKREVREEAVLEATKSITSD